MEDKIFDSDFYKKLETVSLYTSMNMNNGTSGIRKSKSKGSSVEFSDFREYNPGDDFKRIDWNAYGRFDKLFVKLFMEEQEALVNVFIDSSKSMDYGENKKYYQALRLSAVVGYIALRNMDRVCFRSLNGDKVNSSPVFFGRQNFERCINFLKTIEFNGRTELSQIIKEREIKQGGISVLISDFLQDVDIGEIIKYLLYKKQEVILVHILSAEELSPDLEGRLKLIDSETGNEKDIAVTSSVLKKYKIELSRFMDSISNTAVKLGAHYIQISSNESLESIIFEKFVKKGILRG